MSKEETTALSALKLALEALELNNSEWKYLADSGDSGYCKAEDQGHYQLTNEVITALREALNAPLAEQPAQQEPVATLEDLEQEIYENTREFVSRNMMNWMLKRFYTSPPAQRTWVDATTWRGLTDEEILIMSRYDLEYAALIGEVQRKLKEKNT